MCWQCAVNKPDKYLAIFDSFVPRGWDFGPESGPGVFEFELDGEIYHTNPDADISFFSEALPGERDAEGTPWFLDGPFEPDKHNKSKTHKRSLQDEDNRATKDRRTTS